MFCVKLDQILIPFNRAETKGPTICPIKSRIVSIVPAYSPCPCFVYSDILCVSVILALSCTVFCCCCFFLAISSLDSVYLLTLDVSCQHKSTTIAIISACSKWFPASALLIWKDSLHLHRCLQLYWLKFSSPCAIYYELFACNSPPPAPIFSVVDTVALSKETSDIVVAWNGTYIV